MIPPDTISRRRARDPPEIGGIQRCHAHLHLLHALPGRGVVQPRQVRPGGIGDQSFRIDVWKDGQNPARLFQVA